MRVSFKTHNDGSVVLHLDNEAARAVFVSVIFAAKFHQGFEMLAKVATQGLEKDERTVEERTRLCQ